MNLLLRKVAITFVATAASAFLLSAPSLVDAFEAQDWSNLQALAVAAGMGAVAAGARALIAALTAFVPSDAETGANLLGKYKPDA